LYGIAILVITYSIRGIPMTGRPKREEDVEVVFLRLPKDVLVRVVRCTGMIEMRQGVKLNKTEAFRRILEAGCAALEERREGSETPAPAQIKIAEIAGIVPVSIAKLSDIAGEDVAVPGYGFPEDEEELPAPASHTNGTGAPAPQPPAQPAIPLALEPAPKTVQPVAVPQASETPEPAVQSPRAKTPGKHGLSRETLEWIAEERTHCEGLSLSAFAQRLHDKGIYSATAKDGSHVPANPGNVKKWLDKAREAGLL
jgi:hypothetical protein